jgi:hypothetical protein
MRYLCPARATSFQPPRPASIDHRVPLGRRAAGRRDSWLTFSSRALAVNPEFLASVDEFLAVGGHDPER